MTIETSIEKAASVIAAAGNAAALTGAGISVESGIPPFRGRGGVWEKFDPAEYAHIDSFLNDPEKVWREFLILLKDTLDRAVPNEAHKGLAQLEHAGILRTIITQNVDGLHQMAGSSDVIEFHGTFASYRCINCSACRTSGQIDTCRLPPRCDCGGVFRPECVFFGEIIPPYLLWRSQQVSSECDAMIVVGTSAVVHPAAMIPVIAKESGATIIEINAEKTSLTDQVSDYFLQGKAGEIVSGLVKEVERIR